jgi:hypothetical protein
MEEKLPFTAFRYASGVLVFYVHGHMFSFFDCDNFSVITLDCPPEESYQLMTKHLRTILPHATDKQISKLLR